MILSFCVHSLTLQKNAEWPILADDSVVYDNDYIFHGSGSEIKIFSKDRITFQNNFTLDTRFNIQALILDETSENIYAAAGKSGIFIIDYTDIHNLKVLAQINDVPKDPGFLQGEARDYINAAGMKLKDKYLYVADDSYGFRIFDISDAQKPSYVSGYRQDGPSEQLTTGGYFDLDLFTYNSRDYLCILDLYYGLKVFDVTDPFEYDNPVSPEDSSTKADENVLQPKVDDPDPVAGLDLRSSFYNKITLANDITTRNIDNIPYIFLTDRSAKEGKAVVGKLKFTDTERENKQENQFKFKDPDNIGRCDDLIKAKSLNVDDDFAYIADGDIGFAKIDIINPESTNENGAEAYKKVQSYDNNYKNAYSIKYNPYLKEVYFADTNKGLSKIEITTPVESASTGAFYNFNSIDKSGSVLAAASEGTESKGFFFFNAENTFQPKFIGKIDTQNDHLHVKKFMNTFAGADSSKLYIFKNTSSSPAVQTSINLQNSDPQCIGVYSNYIYAGSNSGIDIYKYENSQISFIKNFSSGSISTLFVYTDLLFAGSETNVDIFLITTPKKPSEMDSITVQNNASDIFTDGNTIYITNNPKISVFNFSDLALINNINPEENISSIAADSGFLFAGTKEGIKTYSGTDTGPEKLISDYPSKDSVAKLILSESHVYSADSKGGISISEYDKTAESDTEPDTPSEPADLNSSEPAGSSCFINSLF
ncbi:MAG: hypothetical protein ACQER9_04680 [Nanobdellota archaeon]